MLWDFYYLLFDTVLARTGYFAEANVGCCKTDIRSVCLNPRKNFTDVAKLNQYLSYLQPSAFYSSNKHIECMIIILEINFYIFIN